MSYDQLIFNRAVAEGFPPSTAKLIVAQARLESSDYTSNVFKNNNNLFGMKFVGQKGVSRGTLAPQSERTCNGNCNSDYYAKYNSPSDSVGDLVGRLYKITRNGIGFDQLANAKDSTDFATKLKQRGYYGATATQYAKGLNAKLMKINIIELVKENKNTVLIGAIALGLGLYLYLKK